MEKWVTLFIFSVFLISFYSLQTVEAEEQNKKPDVIPSLQEWDGSTGYFTAQSSSTIFVDPDHQDSLMDTAEVLQEDLAELAGFEAAIEVDNHPSKHDIFLTLQDDEDESIGDEGYQLKVDDALEIQANTETGIYYGTRSALQILVQSPEKHEIAKGTAKDFPKYEERGFMLDVGRKYFPMDDLKEYAKIMGWYKMNDFQLHLNDNEIFKDESEEHWDSYSAFRLESETYPDLTAEDGHYTKEAFTELQDIAGKNSLNITPEFDTPSHSLAFTKVKPDLTHPDLPVDHLDITRDESVDFVKSVWDEYLDMFDSDAVHIGADEFYQNDTEMSNVYREYVNSLNEHMNEKGKAVRSWGGLTYYDGDVQVDEDVEFNIWNVGWYNPEQAVDEGYDIINSDDNLLYIVPKADYYNDYLEAENIFNNWEPTDFSNGITISNDEPHLKGGMFAIWNDLLGEKVSIPDVDDRLKEAMPTLAEKMWRGDSDDTSFGEFADLTDTIGEAPGTDMTYDVDTKTDTVLHYSFDEGMDDNTEDQSGNDYNGDLHEVELTDKGKSGNAVVFDGTDSFITTDLDTKGFPWTVSTWVKLSETDQAEDILLDSEYGALKLKQQETGNVGFTREGHDYSFDTAIPTGKWVHVALRGDLDETSLFIDGELQDTLTDNMLLPVKTIGSEENAIKGIVDEFKVYDRKLSANEIASEADTPEWKINLAEGKPATASSSETDDFTPELAFDEDESTRWSSAHEDDEWIYVDLLKRQAINKVVLNWEEAYAKGYKIQVSDDAENWKDVYETEEGAGGVETVYFPEEEARYVRMQGTKRAIDWGYSLYEMKVYSSPSAHDIKQRVEQFANEGEFSDEEPPHLLETHMEAVRHYEDKEKDKKAKKHMKGFQQLIDKQNEQEQISETAYEALTEDAEALLKKWE